MTTVKILHIDDKLDVRNSVRRLLKNWSLGDDYLLVVEQLESYDHVTSSGTNLHDYDLLILDVREGDSEQNVAGAEFAVAVKKMCFVPIIFYTALDTTVKDMASGFITVVKKGKRGPIELKEAIERAIAQPLYNVRQKVRRDLLDEVDRVQISYFWEFLDKYQDLLPNFSADQLTEILRKRASVYLNARSGVEQTHPTDVYVRPPVISAFLTGDVVKYDNKHYVIVTPSCDLQPRGANPPKAEHVKLALAQELNEAIPEVKALKEGNPKAFKSLAGNNRDKGQAERWHFLPPAFDLPGYLIDFQQIRSIAYGTQLERLASLTSPHSEYLLNRFNRFDSRIGIPNLDVDVVIAALTALPAADVAAAQDPNPESTQA